MQAMLFSNEFLEYFQEFQRHEEDSKEPSRKKSCQISLGGNPAAVLATGATTASAVAGLAKTAVESTHPEFATAKDADCESTTKTHSDFSAASVTATIAVDGDVEEAKRPRSKIPLVYPTVHFKAFLKNNGMGSVRQWQLDRDEVHGLQSIMTGLYPNTRVITTKHWLGLFMEAFTQEHTCLARPPLEAEESAIFRRWAVDAACTPPSVFGELFDPLDDSMCVTEASMIWLAAVKTVGCIWQLVEILTNGLKHLYSIRIAKETAFLNAMEFQVQIMRGEEGQPDLDIYKKEPDTKEGWNRLTTQIARDVYLHQRDGTYQQPHHKPWSYVNPRLVDPGLVKKAFEKPFAPALTSTVSTYVYSNVMSANKTSYTMRLSSLFSAEYLDFAHGSSSGAAIALRILFPQLSIRTWRSLTPDDKKCWDAITLPGRIDVPKKASGQTVGEAVSREDQKMWDLISLPGRKAILVDFHTGGYAKEDYKARCLARRLRDGSPHDLQQKIDEIGEDLDVQCRKLFRHEVVELLSQVAPFATSHVDLLISKFSCKEELLACLREAVRTGKTFPEPRSRERIQQLVDQVVAS